MYDRPGNSGKLKVPLVNHELWGKLRPLVKTQDLRLANLRQFVVKATDALTEATERITKIKAHMKANKNFIFFD